MASDAGLLPSSPHHRGLFHFTPCFRTYWIYLVEFTSSFAALESHEIDCCAWILPRSFILNARKKCRPPAYLFSHAGYAATHRDCTPSFSFYLSYLSVHEHPSLSGLLFPQRDCCLFLPASCALDSGSSLEKFRRSPTRIAPLKVKDAGGLSSSNTTGLNWGEQTDMWKGEVWKMSPKQLAVYIFAFLWVLIQLWTCRRLLVTKM